MTIAALFLGIGLLVVGLLALKRRPGPLESWFFITLVLLLVGGVSLGMTGGAVAFVVTPLLNLVGFSSRDLQTSWLGAMALSFLCPPGLLLAHALARMGSRYWLIVAVTLLVYILLASILVYYIVELV